MTFDDPFRLRVLKGLTGAITKVTPANGYKHDLSKSVFRGRSIYGESDPLPMISILEPPIPLEVIMGKADNTKSTGNWELLIQGFIDDDRENPSDPAYHLMGEVKRALVAEKERSRGMNIFGMGPQGDLGPSENRVLDLLIGQGSVRPADEVSAKGYFWLTITLKLAENLRDPYG